MIKKISLHSKNELLQCTQVISASFKTVAEEFHLTENNAPTNPAFLTIKILKIYMNKGIELFGYYENNTIIGCIAIEQSHDEKDIFFIERLAVIPEKRHKGYGTQLIDYAIKRIKEKNGKKASIGIINDNKRLKKWYVRLGFKEVNLKKFNHLPFKVCFLDKKI